MQKGIMIPALVNMTKYQKKKKGPHTKESGYMLASKREKCLLPLYNRCLKAGPVTVVNVIRITKLCYVCATVDILTLII